MEQRVSIQQEVVSREAKSKYLGASGSCQSVQFQSTVYSCWPNGVGRKKGAAEQ